MDLGPTPDDQVALDRNILQGQLPLRKAVSDDKVAIEHCIADVHIAADQYNVVVLARQSTPLMDMAEDPGEDLGHLSAGDVVLGAEHAVRITGDKLLLYHTAYIGIGPGTNEAGIREFGQVLVVLHHQTECAGDHDDRLLAGDVVVRPHDVAIIASHGAHLNRLRNVVVVPAAHRHICECGNVGALVSAVKPVDHSCHLCPGEETVWRHRVCAGPRHDSIFDSPVQGVIRPVVVYILEVSDVGGEGTDGKRVYHQHPCKNQRSAPPQLGRKIRAHYQSSFDLFCLGFLHCRWVLFGHGWILCSTKSSYCPFKIRIVPAINVRISLRAGRKWMPCSWALESNLRMCWAFCISSKEIRIFRELPHG